MILSGEATFRNQDAPNYLLGKVYNFQKQDHINSPVLIEGLTLEQHQENCFRAIPNWNPKIFTLNSFYFTHVENLLRELTIITDINKRVNLEYNHFINTNQDYLSNRVSEYIFDINISPFWYLRLNYSLSEDEEIQRDYYWNTEDFDQEEQVLLNPDFNPVLLSRNLRQQIFENIVRSSVSFDPYYSLLLNNILSTEIINTIETPFSFREIYNTINESSVLNYNQQYQLSNINTTTIIPFEDESVEELSEED